VLILLSLMAFAIGGAFVAQSTGRTVNETIHQVRFLVDAQLQLATELALARKYRLDPSPAIRAQHRQSELRLAEDLRKSPPTPSMATALRAQARYAATIEQLFRAVDVHDAQRVLPIRDRDVHRAFVAVDRAVGAQAAVARRRADQALRSLNDTEAFILTMNSVLSVVGLLLLGVVLAVLRHYRRLVTNTMKTELNRFKQASLTDYLTGLGNHRAYQERLTRSAEESTSTGSVVTIALLDVDELKVLNDRSGHVSGDRLLASLAQVMRAADLTSVPYRLGGDEFAVTFAGMSSEVARVRMEHVRSAVEARMNGTTVSVGISTTSPSEFNLLVVREQADAALYEAKRRGRNCVVTFDEIRNDHAMFLPARVEQVRRLIASPSMGVAFQPIWGVDDRELIGYEALARPSGDDPINPQDAFDIAERIGKAHELDRVCRNAILEKAKALPAGALLFLNVNPQSLDHEGLAGRSLVEAVSAVGLTADRVVLEITERSVVRTDVVVREAMRLRALGFRLALDDAGSGNAGLEMLSKLAVDYVKIDRDVIVRAQAGAGGRGVLAGLIAIAYEIQARIIAEGIEDSEMLDLVLRATRSAPTKIAVQGYYLGRPQSDFIDAREATVAMALLGGPPAAAGVTNVLVAS
jgi:diguanylate cyclase (GGDEF)-like protein